MMRGMTRVRHDRRGFTLIEVMVALTIFALMSGVGYRALEAVLTAAARVEQETVKWRELALAFVSMEQSLTAIVDRPVRERDGRAASAFSGSAAVRNDAEPLLVFTRMGFPDQGGTLADSQRVGYRLRSGQLEQLIWPVLDQAPDSEPRATVLVSGITTVALRYLASSGAWQAAWPPAGEAAGTPVAIEVSLKLATGEQVTRLFAVR